MRKKQLEFMISQVLYVEKASWIQALAAMNLLSV